MATKAATGDGKGSKPKAGRRGNRHPPEVESKVKVALAMNYPVNQIARESGVPRSTVREIRKRMTHEEIEAWRGEVIHSNCEIIAIGHEVIKEKLIDPDAKKSLMEVNATVGTATDKVLTLLGLPTGMMAHLHLFTRVEAESLDTLAERLRRSLFVTVPPTAQDAIDVTPTPGGGPQ